MYHRSLFLTYLFFRLFPAVLLSKKFVANGAGYEEDMTTKPDDKSIQELNERLTKRVNDWGFNLRTYEGLTEDGYILTIHRMTKDDVDLKPPLLIVHGIAGCSPNFLAYRPSLAYFMAERGYDVWVVNTRGNSFSMRHKTLDPNDRRFWDFSFHEIGYYDVPAALRRIKEVTGAAKVHFVGFSMGATAFLVMGSRAHSSVAKDDVASVSLVTPCARLKYYKALSTGTKIFIAKSAFKAIHLFGRGDILTYHKSVALIMYKACSSSGWTGWLCEKYFRHGSLGKDIYDHEGSLEVLSFYPCGASVKSYLHYIQIAETGKFQPYDYGKKQNLVKYQKKSPPEYDLGSIDKKVYLLVGGEDVDADKRDVQWLHKRLKKSVYIGDGFKHFDHRDFLFSTEVITVNKIILEIIEAYEEKRDPHVPHDDV